MFHAVQVSDLLHACLACRARKVELGKAKQNISRCPSGIMEPLSPLSPAALAMGGMESGSTTPMSARSIRSLSCADMSAAAKGSARRLTPSVSQK